MSESKYRTMLFADAVRLEMQHDDASEKTYGWNEAVEYTISGVENDIVAFFFKLVRGLQRTETFFYMQQIVSNAKIETLVELIVLVFQTRATRNMGKGERKLFYDLF